MPPHPEKFSQSHLNVNRSGVTALVVFAFLLGGFTPAWSADADSPAAKRQLDFANGLFIQGAYDLAAKEYEKYLSEHPESATEEYARFQMAECFYNTRQYERAMTIYQNLLQDYPQGEQRRMTLLRLGEISYRLKKFDQAAQLLTVVLNSSPPTDIRVMALYYLGSSYLELGRLDEAEKAFQTQLKDHPDGLFTPFSRFNLADTLSKLGRMEEAVRLWEQVVQDFGASTQIKFRSLAIDALYRLGQTYLDLGRPRDAAGAFGQLADNYPESGRVTSALYQEAWARYEAGQFGEARRKAQMLLKMTERQDLDSIRAGALYLVGLCFFEDQAYEQAIESFQAVQKLPAQIPEKDKYSEKAEFQTVWCYFLKGEPEKAARVGESFLKNYPEAQLRGEIFFILGEIRFRQENYSEAADYYQSLIKNFPESKYLPESSYKFAYSLLAMGRREEAASAFQSFQDNFADNSLASEALLLEAEAWYETRNLEKAQQAYQEFLEKFPEHQQKEYALYKLGQSFQFQQQIAKAAEIYEQLIQQYPDSRFLAPARFWIAYHADQNDNPEKAARLYEALLDEFPKSPFAGQARLRVAMLYYRQNKQNEAASHFLKLIQSSGKPLESLDSPIYFWTAAVFGRNKQYEKAVSIYEKIIERFDQPELVEEALYRKGRALLKMEKWDLAAAAFDQVLERFPNGAYADSADIGRAKIDIRQDNLDAAITRLKRLQGSPDSKLAAESVLLLGQTYEKAGKPDEAIRAYLFLATLFDHPEWVPEAYRKAVELLLAQGQKENARKHFENLKKNYPDSPEVETVQKMLQPQAEQKEAKKQE